jgi:hypothetical protein
LTSWNVFTRHFFGFFELWPLTSWNVFSHHFFGFFELSFYGTIIWIDSWNVFLIIFLS